MNHSTAAADRNTHVKIVALALVAAINGLVIKAGKPTQFTTRSGIEIR